MEESTNNSLHRGLPPNVHSLGAHRPLKLQKKLGKLNRLASLSDKRIQKVVDPSDPIA